MVRKKIMVVDDEESLLILVSNLLETHGFDVITAKNGEECLSALKTEKPDLILLDIMMPGMTGIETAEAIRSDPKTRKIKIVFLTVIESREIKSEKFRKINAVDYITKPFDNKYLVAKIGEILDM